MSKLTSSIGKYAKRTGTVTLGVGALTLADLAATYAPIRDASLAVGTRMDAIMPDKLAEIIMDYPTETVTILGTGLAMSATNGLYKRVIGK